jgi:multidrug efflux pump subunit AcrA (membrane-fusion protein)
VNPLELRNVGNVEISISPAAIDIRDAIVASAGWISKVTTQSHFTSAVEALKRLRVVAKSVEASRVEIKGPVLEIGKRIDATAKQFVAEVDTEILRLTALLTSYEVEQRRIAAEAERQRQEEERRRQAEEAARMAEITRQQQAAARAELLANTERERAAAEARRIEAEKAAAIERAAAAERQANLPVVVEPPKVAGTVVREDWTFEVTDLRAFSKAYPDLVEITIRRADVLKMIRGGCRQLAHARIYTETKVGVRV